MRDGANMHPGVRPPATPKETVSMRSDLTKKSREEIETYARKVVSGEVEPDESMGQDVALCVMNSMIDLLDTENVDSTDDNLADVGAIAWLAFSKRSLGTVWQAEFCRLLVGKIEDVWPTSIGRVRRFSN